MTQTNNRWEGTKSVSELSRDELIELKQAYLCETQYSVSWGELVYADEIVDDTIILDYYGDISFVCEDFCCNYGNDEN